MRNSVVKKVCTRKKRSRRVRKRTRGSTAKPRLSVMKTNTNIYAQLIDDEKGITLASVSTIAKAMRKTSSNKKCAASGKELGKTLAEQAKSKGVKDVVFDRGPFKYHGIIAAFADGAREAGLNF